jgi:hypothetical protein
MKIWPNLQQGSEEWFRARCGRPTASQFSRIITATGKKSSQIDDYVIELVAECIRPDEIPAFVGNKHTDRGNELEPEARETFARLTGLHVAQVGFVTRADGIVGCSPDGMILSRPLEDGDDEAVIAKCAVGGLEIKCPLAKNHARYLIDGVLPDQYRAQVHGSMAVTGLRQWWFISYCPGLVPFILRVDRDAETERMVAALDEFLIYYAARRAEILPLLRGGREAA